MTQGPLRRGDMTRGVAIRAAFPKAKGREKECGKVTLDGARHSRAKPALPCTYFQAS